jgi:predicted membrane channel-forming protein YqfA (hemolysin III family)
MKTWIIILGVIGVIAGLLFYYLNQVPLIGYTIPDSCWWIFVVVGAILFFLGLLVP